MLWQTAQAIPDGPAWVAALGIVVPGLLAGVKLGMGLVKPGGNGNGREVEKAIEFRATTNATLSRLTTVVEKQAETQALLVRAMDRIGERVEDHDGRTSRAIAVVDDTHRLALDLHRRLVS